MIRVFKPKKLYKGRFKLIIVVSLPASLDEDIFFE